MVILRCHQNQPSTSRMYHHFQKILTQRCHQNSKEYYQGAIILKDTYTKVPLESKEYFKTPSFPKDTYT
uniref:Putative ovule protein n=1 Tax=Solanum chacoense TaxID=4108 RepID=A0A0V0GEU3_SOLCH